MTDLVSNYAKGRFIEWADLARTSANGEAIMVVLYKAAGLPSAATLRDCQSLADVATAGAVEADFTFTGGTAARRKVITGTDITVTVDLVNDKALFDLADLTWTAAGGTLNNTLGMLATFFRRGSGDGDSAIRLISCHDYAGSTTGVDLKAVIPLIASDT